MSSFAIRNPYFIIVVCLIVAVVGVVSLVRMPVDMFPPIRIPVVVAATFYSGMPPEQVETSITSRFERFFTLASNIDHIESRSLPGVSLIKVYFQPGTDPDSAVNNISNLAMANLRRLPPGTLPPVVMRFDASSLPVCLVTVKGEGLTEAALRDLAQFNVRNQLAGVPGASVPPPFGGFYRQIMIYANPAKMESYQLSPMDLVRAVNDSNLILPAGDVKIGPIDYAIYSNSQLRNVEEVNQLPIKTVGDAVVRLTDVAEAKDEHQIQYNAVRVDSQPSVYISVLKQGGDTNTIAVVEGIKKAVADLFDVPKELVSKVVFDQSVFVKRAIETLVHEGGIGLFLTSAMILLFLGSMRATVAVFLSIPLSALAAFLALWISGNGVDTMILGGLALAFSRLIDNSVVVLENIFRHLEAGETPHSAAEKGGREVALPVLSATLTTAVVFFPVLFLYGVSKFLFSALALAVVLSLAASYVVALTVVPVFCARYLKSAHSKNWFHLAFNRQFTKFVHGYDHCMNIALKSAVLTVAVILLICAASAVLYPKVGLAFFPRTDAGQFVINVKAATGTRLEISQQEIEKVEQIIRETIPKDELDIIVSNIGVTPGFSSMYSSNSGSHTAFVQASLRESHKRSSFEYMDAVRGKLAGQMPQLQTYFQTGSMVDAILNLGLPAPIDLQVSGSNLQTNFKLAGDLAAKVRKLPGVRDIYIPQDLDYPSIEMDIDRTHAAKLGLQQKEVISNVITSLVSNQMIAPSYWVDPKSGLDYMLTVQYPENQVRSMEDLKSIPMRGTGRAQSSRLDAMAEFKRTLSPTEVDHYQLRRVIDVFVGPSGEDLGKVASGIDRIVAGTKIPDGVRVDMRGMVQGMRISFTSFGLGLILSVVLLYLILVAQFKSFLDPALILLAVPPGLAGVMVTLVATNTTLNVQSLMGIVMMVGIVVSNSILIVEFTHRLHQHEGMSMRDAVAHACRIRLRPVLMTSFATLIGLLPMALKLGTGSEAYAPLARAIIGGLTASLIATVFLVPSAMLLMYGKREVAG
jgi:hydrophobic/amphiphilic exporter-1 (mainly G- bacteria), HAE1 family